MSSGCASRSPSRTQSTCPGLPSRAGAYRPLDSDVTSRTGGVLPSTQAGMDPVVLRTTAADEEQEVPAARERDRPVMRVLVAAGVERGDDFDLPAARADSMHDATAAWCEEDDAGVRPGAPTSLLDVGDRLWQSAGDRDRQQLADTEEGERAAVGRPERITRFFAPRDRARFTRHQRADVEAASSRSLREERDHRAIGRNHPPRRHWTRSRTPRRLAGRSRASAVGLRGWAFAALYQSVAVATATARLTPATIHGSHVRFCLADGVTGESAGTTRGAHRTSTRRGRRTRGRCGPRRCRAGAASDPARDSARADRARGAGVGRQRRRVDGSRSAPRARRRHVSPSKTRAAGQHLEEDAAEGPDVGALDRRLAARLLRCHVGGRARGSCPTAVRPRVIVGEFVEVCPAAARRSSALARPKSSTFTVPSARTLMFAGFRSRWMMPGSWAASSASAICRRGEASSERQRALRAMRDDRSSPSTSSITSADVEPCRLDAVDRRDVRMIERRQRLALRA